jgi:hypothetical protein
MVKEILNIKNRLDQLIKVNSNALKIDTINSNSLECNHSSSSIENQTTNLTEEKSTNISADHNNKNPSLEKVSTRNNNKFSTQNEGQKPTVSSANDTGDDGFIQVISRKKKRRTAPVCGTRSTSESLSGSSSTANPGLQTVARRAQIYIGRLNSNTDVALVKNHIIANTPAKDVDVTKIEGKSQHASFRVSCSLQYADKVKDPQLWSEGTLINRYFFKINFPTRDQTQDQT